MWHKVVYSFSVTTCLYIVYTEFPGFVTYMESIWIDHDMSDYCISYRALYSFSTNVSSHALLEMYNLKSWDAGCQIYLQMPTLDYT